MSSSAVSPVVDPSVSHALLVSKDLTAIGQIIEVVQQFAFTVEVCSEPAGVASLISTRKFHAIILDVASDESLLNVLEVIRCSPSNQNSVTFAIVDSAHRPPSKMQSNFVMQKPLTDNLIRSTLKAAMGLIVRDLRRYFRCPVKGPARIQIAGQPQIDCELMNISEGGIAVNTSVPLPSGAVAKAEFSLPDIPGAFQVDAEVCWSDNRGRAGLHFLSLSPELKGKLQGWLSTKIEQSFPGAAIQPFQAKQ